MCITSSRSILDNTYIGAWDINHPIYGYRHVLSYQNRVQNLDKGPNCMLLHIQSKENLKPEWIIDTSKNQNFLLDLYNLIDPIIEEEEGIEWMSSPREKVNYIVEIGIYHIAILNNLSKEIRDETLLQIPKSKFPSINDDFFTFFEKKFPGFPLLLCCFDNKDAKMAAPIMVHYPPIFPEKLMLNSIDSHGKVPNTDERIMFHQKLIIGSYKSEKNLEFKLPKVSLENFPDSLKQFLPKYALASDSLHFSGPNKDFCVSLNEIHKNTIPKISLGLLGNENSEVQLKLVREGNIIILRHL